MTGPGLEPVGRPAPAAAESALVLLGATKRFGATLALDEVTLTVRPGTVHALVGGNGSGKSTAIKVLAGVHRADAGLLRIRDREHDLLHYSAVDGRQAGLRFVHQDLGLFEGLSIEENFALDAGFPTTLGSGIRWRALRARVAEILAEYELAVDPRTPVNELRPSDRTMVAIARALQDGARAARSADDDLVLVLDEPTASLAQHESALLLAKVRRLADLGRTVLLVSHRMTEVLAVAHDFTVFRDGRTVATLVDARPTEDELVALMAGRAVQALRSESSGAATGQQLLSVRGLTVGPLRGLDLEVGRGEIVGVAGLVGSGRSTLLRTLFGDIAPVAGSMSLAGATHAPSSVGHAVAAGVALVPENRGREAAFPDLTVTENLSMARLRSYWRPQGMNRSAERTTARRLLEDFAVKVAGPGAMFTSMSGGNQQKVILARWLQRDPDLLLLDEPTQGVDVMSRVDIYRIVREAAGRGSAVLVASSDASELLALCDRIVILREGVVDEQLQAGGLDPDELTAKLLRAARTQPVTQPT